MDGFIRHTYFNTYYYANIVTNVLSGDPDLAGFIHNFFVPDGIIYHLSMPFQKRSAFHAFIEHIVSEFFDEEMHEHDSSDFEYCSTHTHAKFTPYADDVLRRFGFETYASDGNFSNYEEVEEYHNSLYETGVLWEVYPLIADEVFYIMFNNRSALLHFNYMIAQHIDVHAEDFENEDYKEYAKLFTKSGKLKRVKIPEWSKKVVYFRDRGRCCFCHQDLSGTLSLNNKKHYDHIIPLAQGGLNDVANLQLLCATCNINKGYHKITTSNLYERWF